MRVVLKEPMLVEQVEQWARETNRPVEKVLEAAVQTYLGNVEREGTETTAETALTLLRCLPPLARLRVIALTIPEVERDLAETPPPLKSLRGLWRDLDFDITAQEIDEARREVWANFPREDF